MKHDIFLSYTHNAGELAVKIKSFLSQNGLE